MPVSRCDVAELLRHRSPTELQLRCSKMSASAALMCLLLLLLKDFFFKSVHTQKFNLPKNIDSLAGSCVVIPCNFQNSSSGHIIWFQYGQNKQIFNSENSSLVDEMFKRRVRLVGNLSKSDCSVRIDKIDKSEKGYYFPQISSDPFISKPHRKDIVYVNVLSSPKNFKFYVPNPMTEEMKYKISCSIEHTCPDTPPELTWNIKGKNTFHLDLGDGRWKMSIETTYTPKSGDNQKTRKCSSNSTSTKIEHALNILYAPKLVTITSSHQTGNVTKGEAVNLTCHGSGNPKTTTVTWFKDNEMRQSSSTSDTLHIEQMTEHYSGTYFCEANNSIGSVASDTITLQCIDTVMSPALARPIYTAALCALLLLLILSLVIGILYRMKKASRRRKTGAGETSRDRHIYINLLVPRDQDVMLENQYLTMQTQSRSPEYEQVSRDPDISLENQYLTTQAQSQSPVYEQVPRSPDLFLENPYTAMQTHNRCPDYEQLQLHNAPATNKPTLQASSSYPEYEVVYPITAQPWKK